MSRTPWIATLTSLSLASLVLLGACNGGNDGNAKARGARGKAPRAFPVEVAPVQAKDVEYAVNAVGSIEAFETVQITSRISGVVDEVLFSEGQTVGKGEPLVQIDARRHALAVEAAEAALQKAKAAGEEAKASLERRESVAEQNPGLIPGEELSTFRTRASTAAAEERAAEVALSQARLDLRDAYVRAPVAGILQSRTVQTGQYVQPGTVLATLLRRDPLLLRFRVPESEAARIEPGQIARFRVRETGEEWTAKIRHVAGAAESETRMVTVTARVEGEELSALRPGAFAEVVVPVASAKDSPVVPQTAIRPSERGFLAFVVEGDTAKERVLQLGMRTGSGLVEVLSGLKTGEELVVRGAEALRDGAKVQRVAASGEEPVPAGGAEPGGKAGVR